MRLNVCSTGTAASTEISVTILDGNNEVTRPDHYLGT